MRFVIFQQGGYMRRTEQNISQALSKPQFITLCNEVAIEAAEMWGHSPEIAERTALLKRLLSKVAAKMGVTLHGFPPHLGATPEETSYLSSLAAVCDTLTSFRRVPIDYDCLGTITEELFNKVKDLH
jgi:hypothetical protein